MLLKNIYKNMWCVMKILLIPFFTAAKAAIMEKCSYETNDLWIKIINLYEEGEMSCDKMVYIGLNKKTGDYITLSGKSVISKSNYSFLYYEFINNDTKYLVKRDNFLEVWNNGKVILSKELKSCY